MAGDRSVIDLHGKLALVTGASSGIGAATATALARQGARLVLVSRTREALEKVAGEIEGAGGEAYVVALDVGDSAAVMQAAEHVTSEIGVPDVIVHSAGGGRYLFVDETSPEELVQMTQVPYHAAFFVTKAFLPAMLARASGAIVVLNTPTVVVWQAAMGYFGARYALRAFVECLRADLRGTGITVTSVNPGNVATEYSERNDDSDRRLPRLANLSPQQSAADVADVVVKAVRRGRGRDVYTPLGVKLMVALARHFPRAMGQLIVATGASRDVIITEARREAGK
ncbi:MAG: SDR family oxidoreductase [Actinomycetota bacterium]|nr:SDR family oxidoreductase [Actinomycetota bacterium]